MMPELSQALIGEFIDAVVQTPDKADALLAEHPALLNARWIHNESVLHFLAVEGFDDGVRFLAVRGAEVDAVNEFGDTPLVDVTLLGLDSVAEILLQHGADPNASSTTNDNPLHCAVRSGDGRLVTLLLRAGANPRYVTDLGESVLDALDQSPENQRDATQAILAEHGVMRDAGWRNTE